VNPELKFHSLVISATTLIIFIIWIQVTDIITTYPYLSIFASGVVSLGIYRSLAIMLLGLFRNSWRVKKWILGPFFMEGVWVGFFVGHQNKVRFFSEIIEQDLNTLLVRGKAFKMEDGSYHGSWISDSINVNVKQAKLSYTYYADIIEDTFVNPGLAHFNLERYSVNKPPIRMYGFSSDLYRPEKLKAYEEKISDKTHINNDDTFMKAKEIYDRNKDHI
jgi:hypothetical protein